MRRGDEAEISVRVLRVSVILVMLFGVETRAELYNFQPISNDSGVSGNIAGGLTVEVAPHGDGSNQAIFKFVNDIPDPYDGNIMRIFFDDTDGLGRISGLIEPGEFGVDFRYGYNGNGNFHGGNRLTPRFQTTEWVEFDHGGTGKIGPGEYLGVVYDLVAGKTFQDLIDAVGDGTSGSMRVGIHVGSIVPALDASDSDSFVMVRVPAPAAVLLGMWGLGMAGFHLRRRRDLANT